MKKFAVLGRFGQLNTMIFFVAILGFFCCSVSASAGDDRIAHKMEIPEGTVAFILK
ncbi:MAG: hypothetical protein LBH37_00155 [Oscillospiraceae bacterium]|jgi:hypothetical protein|nr:hypothetical protein [Oscillospiraceae bacterium]